MKVSPLHPRILLVDDNPAIHDDFRKILGRGLQTPELDRAMAEVFGAEPAPVNRSPSFALDSAYQGQEGLLKVQQALAEGRPYQLAFVDVRMPPGWDGVETIAQIWAIDPAIQIVICTAYSDYSWPEIVQRLGHTDGLVILKKPFDNVEVLQLAHTLTRKWNVTQEAAVRLQEIERLCAQRTGELQEIRRLNAALTVEITERTEAQTALRTSEERLSKAFDASPLAAAILDLEHSRYEYINPAFTEATGHSRHSLIGAPLRHSGLEISDEVWNAGVEQIQTGGHLTRYECTFTRATGETRRGLLWLEPFQLGDGLHLLVLLQDVTEQQIIENQLRQSQKMEAVGQLAAGIAHDFNNLLTVIQGHASLHLHTSTLDPEVASSMKEMHMAAERAADLTRQILAFSRKQVMQLAPLRLDEVVTNISLLMKRLIPATIALSVVSRGENLAVLADRCNVEQVLINLVVNARDAMPGGGHITVAIEPVEVSEGYARKIAEAKAGSFVRINVEDTGTGISRETLEKIFEPFYTTKEVGKGTGMGLSVAQGIVKQHEGWMEVTSTPGAGTIFSVYLPRTAAVEFREPAPAPPVARAVAGQTILIAEDNEDVLRLATFILESSEYKVLSATNGSEALELWKEHESEVQLILTDMVMPGGISGKELAGQIQTLRPDLPIIFTSGYSSDLVAEGIGASDQITYLPKPYLARELTDAVARTLARVH